MTKISLDIFANVLKITTEISHLHKYSAPLLSTLLKHRWQRLQPWFLLDMTLQAWHTCIWVVSPILLCRSSQALPGWMESVAAQLFSGLSRDVRSGSSPGSDWATQGHSETCPEATPTLSWLCGKGRFHVGRWIFAPVWGPEQVFIKDLCAPFIFVSLRTSLPVPAAEKHPNRMMLPPPCFTVGMVPGFFQMWRLEFRPKSSILVSSDQRFLANSKQAVMCLLLRHGFYLATLP